MWSFFDRWAGRASNLLTFWPLIPAGLAGGLFSYLSIGNIWVERLGRLALWSIGLAGTLTAGLILLLAMLVWERAERARAMREWKRRVDTVNPLASSFQQQRISVQDLVHPISKLVIDKQFTDCQLVGPANICPIGRGSFKRVRFSNCSVVVIDSKARMTNVIGFQDCQVLGGEVMNCVMFIAPQQVAAFQKMGVPFLTAA